VSEKRVAAWKQPYLREAGRRIRAVRESRGLPVSEVARRLGWADSQYCAVEAGIRSVSRAALPRLAAALSVSPGDLVPGALAPPPLRLGDHREVLAARVAELRAARGLSRPELARRAALGRTTLRDVELALRPARYATVAALATALGVAPGELVPGLDASGEEQVETAASGVTQPVLPPPVDTLPAPFTPPTVSPALRYRRRSS